MHVILGAGCDTLWMETSSFNDLGNYADADGSHDTFDGAFRLIICDFIAL